MNPPNGIFYYPTPSNKRVRMYVRRGTTGQIEFRLWSADEEGIWDRHGWLSRDVIKKAASMYEERGREADPLELYDVRMADALLKDQEN